MWRQLIQICNLKFQKYWLQETLPLILLWANFGIVLFLLTILEATNFQLNLIIKKKMSLYPLKIKEERKKEKKKEERGERVKKEREIESKRQKEEIEKIKSENHIFQ